MRYAAGHWVEYAEVGLFFVGLAGILQRGGLALRQFAVVDTVHLPPPPAEGQAMQDVPRLLEQLGELPLRLRRSLLAQRLEEALVHVRRQDSAEQLDEELKYLAELPG